MCSFFLKVAFRKNGVILENNRIIIRRKTHYNFKFTYNINYENIDVCQKYDGEMIPSYYRELYNFSVLWFNWDNIVIIIDNNKSKYYLPVYNADDFVEEVNMHVKKAKFFSELKIDDLLKERKLDYSDLSVRWKSANEIDSIYFIDKNGNKVDLIKY